jgi:excinuclease ABC subunit B
VDLNSGQFRVKGDTIDIFPAYGEQAYRLRFWDNELETIQVVNPFTGIVSETLDEVRICPSNLFVTSQDVINQAILEIHLDLGTRINELKSMGKHLEAKRLEERTIYDIEMMKELGYCSGIENYSRYFDRRAPDSRPFCLIDCFPKDFILAVDESHVTVPQIRGMYNGDRARKLNLVEYGFRLPAALDNRPLQFREFESLLNQVIYVSATPADFELEQSGGIVVEQVVRPTGLLDPPIEVRSSEHQIDDLLEEVELTVSKKEKVLVTTLTKKMAEELTAYLIRIGVRTKYIHSDVDTLERVEILNDLQQDAIDVLVGVNLLREGLDLPNVSLVAVLDADKEGFLRSERSLTQTAGRAARNVNGKVIFYADKITRSMQGTMDETERRRAKQKAYNDAHGIVPKTITKTQERTILGSKKYETTSSETEDSLNESPVLYMNQTQLQKELKRQTKLLEQCVKDFDFLQAAKIRDQIKEIQSFLKS